MTDRADDCNRVDSTLTPNPPSDGLGNYTVVGTWGIFTHWLYKVSPADTYQCAVLECGTPNGSFSATNITDPSATYGGGGVVARYADNNNYITGLVIGAVGGGTYDFYLFKKVAGNYTPLGTFYTGPFAANDVLSIDFTSANAIRFKQNGITRVGPVTDAAGSTNTKHGVIAYNNTGYNTPIFDDLSFVGAAGGGVGSAAGSCTVSGSSIAAGNGIGASAGTSTAAAAASNPSVYTGSLALTGAHNFALRRALIAAVAGGFPYWFRATYRSAKRYLWDNSNIIIANERADGSQGTFGYVHQNRPKIQKGDGSASVIGASTRAQFPYPYVEQYLWLFESATHARIFVGTGDGTYVEVTDATTPCTPNLTSGGTGQTAIGGRAYTTTPPSATEMDGWLKDVVAGRGVPTVAGLTRAFTRGADYNGITCTGGGPTNWWPCTPLTTVNDVIGTEHMTNVGGLSFVADNLDPYSEPDRAGLTQWIFKGAAPTAAPTVALGSSLYGAMANMGPVQDWTPSIVGQCNKKADGSTLSGGIWSSKFKFYPSTIGTPRHCALVNTGHAFPPTDEAAYHTGALIQEILNVGISVLQPFMPGYGPDDPDYAGTTFFDHRRYWALTTDSVNVLERFVGLELECINYLVNTLGYTDISPLGMSGGGFLSPVLAALFASNINTVCSCRGGIASDFNFSPSGPYSPGGEREFDYEVQLYNLGASVNRVYDLACAPNRKLLLIHHQSDPVGYGQNEYSLGTGGGAYYSEAGYRAAICDWLKARNPLSQPSLYITPGPAAHAFDSFSRAEIVRVLQLPLIPLTGGGSGNSFNRLSSINRMLVTAE